MIDREEFVRDMRKRQRDELDLMVNDLRKSKTAKGAGKSTIKDEVYNA